MVWESPAAARRVEAGEKVRARTCFTRPGGDVLVCLEIWLICSRGVSFWMVETKAEAAQFEIMR